MIESKFVLIFRTLEKSDLRQLKKWVNSPMHNEHKELSKLFDFIFKRAALNTITLRKERAWKYLFEGKPYNDLKLRHLMSLGVKLLEEFVRYKEAKLNGFDQDLLLANYYYQHNLFQSSQQQVKKISQELQQSEEQDEYYHFNQYQLEVLKFELEGTQDRTRATNLTEITQNASLSFILTTLRYAYTAMSHQNLRKTDYKIPLLEAVLTEVEEQSCEEYPLVMIYYHGYYTLKIPKEEHHFIRLKYYLNTKGNSFSDKERKALFLMTLNYSIKRINTGSDIYIREAFELYKKGIEGGFLIENDLLSQFSYKNTVALGLKLEEFDWVEQFLSTYTIYLEPNLQVHYQHYNLAKLAFYKEDFDTAMSLLTQIEYDDLLLNMGAKVMLLKIYYQQKYWDALDALLQSVRVFIQRKKMMSYHKTNFQNLLSLTKKMLKLLPSDKAGIQKLKEQVQSTPLLMERDWLLEQIDKL